MKNLLNQMCERVLRHARGIRMETPIPRIGIGVVSHPGAFGKVRCQSGVCLVLQGAKRMIVGDRLLRYEAGSCFASLIEFPALKAVVEPAGFMPYVATSLTLDADTISTLLACANLPAGRPPKARPAFETTVASVALLDAWDRYLALLDTPEDIPALAAARERELLYRLLQSPHGPMLRQIARKDGRLSKIRGAIEWMQLHFEHPMSIVMLANTAGMSVPSFNRHFRAVTSTSPLQYQKTLKLQAARRQLSIKSEVADAAYAVGYESASQFSREYSRLFGVSPRDDARMMRSQSTESERDIR